MYREEFYYKAEYSEIKNCREQVKNLSLKFNFFNIFKENIELSIGELFTNIIKHGQKNLEDHRDIKVYVNIDENKFEMIFEYKGEIPTKERIKEVSEMKDTPRIEELSESGRGIFIISKLMDKLYYETENGISRAVMIKFL